MRMISLVNSVLAGACILALVAGCAVIEKGGTYTRMSGEAMTDYSKRNEGFVGTLAGVGGTVNTAVGGGIENAAKGSAGESPDKPRAEAAAANAAEPMSIIDMQKRLLALGYPAGTADGVMGKKAVDALKAFQKDNNLPVTGELNNETIDKLRTAKRAG